MKHVINCSSLNKMLLRYSFQIKRRDSTKTAFCSDKIDVTVTAAAKYTKLNFSLAKDSGKIRPRSYSRKETPEERKSTKTMTSRIEGNKIEVVIGAGILERSAEVGR